MEVPSRLSRFRAVLGTRDAVLTMVLIALTAIVFARAADLPLVNYDDPGYVNSHVKSGLSLSNLKWGFTTFEMGSWNPLVWLSLQMDAEIWGDNSRAYHLTNLVLHVVNGALLYLVLRFMTGSVGCSWVVALLFCVHPLRVESVAWVSERKDVLSGLFWMLTLWAYWWYTRAPSIRRMALVIAGFVLGLASKPMVITLPCVLLLLDAWPLGRLKTPRDLRPLLIEKIPLFVMMALGAGFAVLSQQQTGSLQGTEFVSMPQRLVNAAVGYCVYLRMTIWPSDLAVFYPIPVGGRPLWQLPIALCVLVGISAAVIWVRRSRPYLLFGWLWFLGTLVPVIGIVQVGLQAYADRYTYLPSIGLFIALVWGGAELFRLRHYTVHWAWVSAAVASIAAILLTQRQLSYWENSGTLWERTLSVTENNWVAWNNLGHYHLDVGPPDKPSSVEHWKAAEHCYTEACKINPNDFSLRFFHAETFLFVGKFEESEREARRALESTEGRTIDNWRRCLFMLGELSWRQGRLQEAVAWNEKSIAVEDHWYTRAETSRLLAELDRVPQAIEHLLVAEKLSPRNAMINASLAGLYGRMSNWDAAQSQWQGAVEKAPKDVKFRTELGEVLLRLGKTGAARQEAEEATRLDPKWLMNLQRLAWVQATHADPAKREPESAFRLSRLACLATEPPQPESLDIYAAAAASLGQFENAQSAAEQGMRLAQERRQPGLATAIEKRLALYRERKPFFQQR